MEAAQVPPQEAEAQEAPEGQPEEQQSPDYAPVLERLDQLGRRMDEFEPLLSPEQPDEEQVPFADEIDALVDEQGNLDPEDLEQTINRRVESLVDEKLGEQNQRVQHVEAFLQAQALDQLEEEYPELQDPEKATELIGKVKAFAGSRGLDPADPEIVEMVYLAEQARERAAQEAPGGTDVSLETAGGTVPPAPSTDVAQDILNAGSRSNVFG